tara:strand:- start:871 stop:2277 length:1407 start_codon:yes stop_codon:yes gene_type:complete
MPFLVPIIIGSSKDLNHANKIKNKLSLFNISCDIRISSAHKATDYVMGILNNYEKDITVPVIITCAGKSNALSGVVDSNITLPVIACPPITKETMFDLYSSTSMPTDVCPMVVLGPENAGLAAAKICGLQCQEVRRGVLDLHLNNTNKLIIEDTQQKYNDDNLLTKLLPSCVVDSREEYGNHPMEGMQFLRSGKIRDLYLKTNSENMYLVGTDKLSSFDRVITSIPLKGEILNKVTKWWFDKTADIVPNHYVSHKGCYMEVKKTEVIMIEFVMRSYLTGSTSTSIWKNYEKGMRTYCGHQLPDGMVRNQPLAQPLLTPTTKGEVDELISKDEILAQGIMTHEEWETCATYAHALFKRGQELASRRGLILVDTKYEFGKLPNGDIILIDELHTPDSSRFWIKHSYQQRFNNKQEPEMIDKEFIRKWVKSQYDDPYSMKPEEFGITDEMRLKTTNRYLQLYNIITGKELL